jgi:histidinol-phosphate aminotransferase
MMGLLDYYRQFEDMDESEVNEGLRERRARQKALALEHVPPLDLSGTEWPELPNADVVAASVYMARGRLNGYPDGHATPLRRALSERHMIKSSQIVIGNGAAELIQTALQLVVVQGEECIIPWPSYRLFPTVVMRAGGRPVPVDLVEGSVDPASLLAAVTPRTRAILICNPNDPTGTYVDAETIGGLLSELPHHVHVLLDEAYIQFQDVEDEDAALRLVEAFPHLLVFRTFSKAYGLSGLRAGYAIGSPVALDLLGSLPPVLGVNALTQAAVLQALKIGDRDLERRRATVIEQRTRVLAALDELPVHAPPSEANFIWLRADGMNGNELAERLERARVHVARGGPLGDDDHVRAAIRDSSAADRLLWAIGQALERS